MARTAILLTIVGEVQGVGFRAFIRGEAQRFGLHGWVRNRFDGSVEALVIGEADTLDVLIESCGTNAPPAADIHELNFCGAEDDGSLEFIQLPTV